MSCEKHYAPHHFDECGWCHADACMASRDKRLAELRAEVKRLREVLRECRRFIDASPVPSDLWASGLCRELDEVLKGPPAAADTKGGER